jgi:hypothetical protein
MKAILASAAVAATVLGTAVPASAQFYEEAYVAPYYGPGPYWGGPRVYVAPPAVAVVPAPAYRYGPAYPYGPRWGGPFWGGWD